MHFKNFFITFLPQLLIARLNRQKIKIIPRTADCGIFFGRMIFSPTIEPEISAKIKGLHRRGDY